MDILNISRIALVSLEMIAFATACFTFRHHSPPFRVLFYLLFYIVISESIGLYIDLFCSRELQRKTVIGITPYLVAESLSIYLLGLKASKSRFYRSCIRVGLFTVLVFSLLNVYFNGVSTYPTVPMLLMAVEGLFVFLGLIILGIESRHFFKEPLFFLCLGMIVFYGCTMPYISVVSYFAKVDNATLKKLAQILFISNYIRYSLTVVAYIILYRQGKAKIVQHNTAANG